MFVLFRDSPAHDPLAVSTGDENVACHCQENATKKHHPAEERRGMEKGDVKEGVSAWMENKSCHCLLNCFSPLFSDLYPPFPSCYVLSLACGHLTRVLLPRKEEAYARISPCLASWEKVEGALLRCSGIWMEAAAPVLQLRSVVACLGCGVDSREEEGGGEEGRL